MISTQNTNKESMQLRNCSIIISFFNGLYKFCNAPNAPEVEP